MSTVMIWQTSSTGFEDTEKLGRLFGNKLRGGEVIELRSDLGGGKTTFARGLAQGAGSQDTATSPTFTISKIYRLPGKKEIHHFDFYRLSEPGILADQLAESLLNEKVITIIEWSDIVKGVLPDDRLVINFEMVKDNPDRRDVKISFSDRFAGLVQAVETEWMEIKP